MEVNSNIPGWANHLTRQTHKPVKCFVFCRATVCVSAPPDLDPAQLPIVCLLIWLVSDNNSCSNFLELYLSWSTLIFSQLTWWGSWVSKREMYTVVISVRVCLLSCFRCVRLFATSWAVAPPGSSSMRFSREEYWSGLLRPPPGDLPNPGTEPKSLTTLALAGRFFTTSTTWEAPAIKVAHLWMVAFQFSASCWTWE